VFLFVSSLGNLDFNGTRVALIFKEPGIKVCLYRGVLIRLKWEGWYWRQLIMELSVKNHTGKFNNRGIFYNILEEGLW